MEHHQEEEKPCVELIHPLFAHIKNLISLERQKELLAGSKIIGTTRTRYRYGFTKLSSLIVGEDEKLKYKSWDECPFDMTREAHDINELVKRKVESLEREERERKMKLPDSYDVGMIECLGYEEGSILNEHVDFVRGFAIIITLGATTDFYFKVGTEEEISVKIKSGDAVMFPSHGAANVLHGIRGFDDDCPEWFKFENFRRLCIQYRQSFEHVLVPSSGFEDEKKQVLDEQKEAEEKARLGKEAFDEHLRLQALYRYDEALELLKVSCELEYPPALCKVSDIFGKVIM